MEGILLADFRIVIQGTENNLIVFGELLYLVESSQLVAFFERIRDAGQENENLHLIGIRWQR